jgi:hypothetical protein
MVTASANSVSGSVNVLVSAELSVEPESIQIDGIVGGTATFTVRGGVPGYTITTDDLSLPPDQATLANSGDSFTVTVDPLTRAKSVEFTVRDSVGSTVTATVDIIEDTETLDLQPSTFSIGTTTAPAAVNIQYTVTGGAAPYTVYFSLPMFIGGTSPTYVQNGETIGTAGTNMQVFTVRYRWTTPVTATFDMTVFDSFGDQVSSTVNMAP